MNEINVGETVQGKEKFEIGVFPRCHLSCNSLLQEALIKVTRPEAHSQPTTKGGTDTLKAPDSSGWPPLSGSRPPLVSILHRNDSTSNGGLVRAVCMYWTKAASLYSGVQFSSLTPTLCDRAT